MRYLINDIEIKSENTAKSEYFASKYVISYIHNLKQCDSILDFGCGKLRYADYLLQVAHRVTFIDSELQLNRQQVVKGVKTTVKDYISKNYKNSCAIPYEQIQTYDVKFNYIFCSNVLSAIPSNDTIKDILYQLKRHLKSDGKLIIINQHKDGYFNKYHSGDKHLYGYIYKGRKGYSYYGIINKAAIYKMLVSCDYSNIKTWVINSMTFTEAY